MPSLQRGTVTRRGNRWLARWYDEHGRRRSKGGFLTRREALEFLNGVLPTVTALRRGDHAALRRQTIPTLAELADEFERQHLAEPSTVASVQKRLRYALEGPRLDGRGGWAGIRIDRLNPADIGAWRKQLPARSGFGIHKALRQVLHYAVRTRLLDENPAALVPNPRPKRPEVQTFTLPELAAIGEELPAGRAGIPVFGALTGLRPCEWMALERRDVDQGVVHVRRTIVDGAVKPYGKTSRSLRAVPLPALAAGVLDRLPARIDTRLLFPAGRGGPLTLTTWRHREWNPALNAAGVPHRSPYALRHTYASLSIAAGTSLYELARLMGTSVAMLDDTYGHLLPDALDRARTALDTFLDGRDQQAGETYGH